MFGIVAASSGGKSPTMVGGLASGAEMMRGLTGNVAHDEELAKADAGMRQELDRFISGIVKGDREESTVARPVPKRTASHMASAMARAKRGGNIAKISDEELSKYAGKKRYAEFCVEFCDQCRLGNLEKVIESLDLMRALDIYARENPSQPNTAEGGVRGSINQSILDPNRKPQNLFADTRKKTNADRQHVMYDDAVFELVNFVDPRNAFTPLLWSVIYAVTK